MSSSVLPMFSCKSFIVSGLIFRSLIHFEFIFVYGVNWLIEVAQSCLTLCDPMDYSLPGFSIHGIFQARVLEWVVISFSRRSSWFRDQTQVFSISGRWFTFWATSVRKCSNFILLHVAVPFSHHHLLKRLSLPHCIFLPHLSKITYQ